ncbi:DUF4160 domain-containing protein [Allochromatium palmeri]|uniref:DUF4160 domain-containing protein n=1 Tax=Allochromatium palmeri TaxID=231048 RepID=A0A6N8ECN8_9GAMM|nr:DUF4160 domain-containing protein [Allochromatium palmeri]MTW21260.1 DUF4160 domain-containing protein [Allochromatium palmeri]
MPEISRFLGIIIYMNWGDHPLPHFHARYGDYEIAVEIETGVVRGEFPKRALRAVLEWADLNQEPLMQNWNFAIQRKPLHPVPPLE